MGTATALDQPRVGIDLVGAVDREVQLAELVEFDDGQTGIGRDPGGRRRGGGKAGPAQLIGALAERAQQICDGRAGAQPDPHPVFDQLSRGPGSSLLVGLDLAGVRGVRSSLACVGVLGGALARA